MAITYTHTGSIRDGNLRVSVYIDGRTVGYIKAVESGFRYYPKSSKVCGEVLPSILAVKNLLEGRA